MSEQTAPTTTKQDPWSIWFSRLIQIIGLGTFIEQVAVGQGHTDRPWILLISLAMMIGGLGLQLLLRALIRIGNGGP